LAGASKGAQGDDGEDGDKGRLFFFFFFLDGQSAFQSFFFLRNKQINLYHSLRRFPWRRRLVDTAAQAWQI